MVKYKSFLSSIFFLLTAVLVIACSRNSSSGNSTFVSSSQTELHTSTTEAANSNIPSLFEYFDKNYTSVSKSTVECVLADESKTLCVKVSVIEEQSEHEMGPWCPRTIEDGSEESGIWIHDGKVYDADGEFMQNLAAFYNDDEWQLFDTKTGKIKVTDSKEACFAAAKPQVEEEYQNYCVECQTSYVAEENKSVSYLIPINPKILGEKAIIDRRLGIGLAFNGVKFDVPAPTEAILAAHTLAPFDDCGGHVNPHVGYHYHAAKDCSKSVQVKDGHGAIIGVAFDGHAMFSRTDKDGNLADDLDECGGHSYGTTGYHYHVNAPGKNEILSCLRSQPGCMVTGDEHICRAKQSHGPRSSAPPKS